MSCRWGQLDERLLWPELLKAHSLLDSDMLSLCCYARIIKTLGFTHIIQWPLTIDRSALWQAAPYANRFCAGESRLPDDCEWGLKLSTCCILQQRTSCPKYILPTEKLDLHTYLHIPVSVLSKCSTEMVVASCNASSSSSPFSFSPVPKALISRMIQSAMQQKQNYQVPAVQIPSSLSSWFSLLSLSFAPSPSLRLLSLASTCFGVWPFSSFESFSSSPSDSIVSLRSSGAKGTFAEEWSGHGRLQSERLGKATGPTNPDTICSRTGPGTTLLRLLQQQVFTAGFAWVSVQKDWEANFWRTGSDAARICKVAIPSFFVVKLFTKRFIMFIKVGEMHLAQVKLLVEQARTKTL